MLSTFKLMTAYLAILPFAWSSPLTPLSLEELIRARKSSPELSVRDLLWKRMDFNHSVCGSSEGNQVADQTQTMDLWNDNNIDGWFSNLLKPYIVMNWKYEGNPRNIQDIVLHAAGNEGKKECEVISTIACSADWDYNLCLQYPEAHFVWLALFNYADWMSRIYEFWSANVGYITPDTNQLREAFFSPITDLTSLLVPIGIVSGITGAISGFYGPVAVIAGAGAIANAIITQISLQKVDPTEQWGAVQDVVSNAYKSVLTAIDKAFQDVLNQLPQIEGGVTPYNEDIRYLPKIVAKGKFVDNPYTDVWGNGSQGAFVASAVNSLWIQDHVFLMKISDKTYGLGKACDALPEMTVCVDGVAYIWMRWTFVGAIATEFDISFSYLNSKTFYVWGAYDYGSNDGKENANRLTPYKLDLRIMTDSAIKTFADHGFPFKGQDENTIKNLQDDSQNLDLEHLLQVTFPICDMDKVLNGKHLKVRPDKTGDKLNDNPIVTFGACSCRMDPKWPGDIDTYKYDIGGYTDDQCKKDGWSD